MSLTKKKKRRKKEEKNIQVIIKKSLHLAVALTTILSIFRFLEKHDRRLY